MYRLFVKRLLDIVLSAVGIVVFSPLYLLIGLMVRIQMGAGAVLSGAHRKGRKALSTV